MIIIGIVALVVAFFQTIYNALKGNMGTKYVSLCNFFGILAVLKHS